jgi:hypothetical protein
MEAKEKIESNKARRKRSLLIESSVISCRSCLEQSDVALEAAARAVHSFPAREAVYAISRKGCSQGNPFHDLGQILEGLRRIAASFCRKSLESNSKAIPMAGYIDCHGVNDTALQPEGFFLFRETRKKGYFPAGFCRTVG